MAHGAVHIVTGTTLNFDLNGHVIDTKVVTQFFIHGQPRLPGSISEEDP
jgi:hypothetical protein